MVARLPIDAPRIQAFCRRWKIVELSLFGSVLTPDFRPDSDVDVLVAFDPAADWSYWDFPAMIEELETLFGRPVDLVERKTLSNPFRRHHILTHRQVVYAGE